MRNVTIGIILILIIGSIGAFGIWGIHKNRALNQQILSLQKEISGLQTSVASSTKNFSAAISSQELANRQVVTQKSQDQLLTGAVAKAGPTVVSIIISQNVPQYEITYENPFGDDPRYQDFGFQIPVYHQIGSKLQKVGAGTGIIFTSTGYIVTNKHVIFDPKAQYAVLLSTGKQQIAQVVYIDAKNDIAIIKIPGNYSTVASIGDSSTLKLGQTVTAIGNALGQYNNSVSVGIISGLNRTIEASDEQGNIETLSNIIQTDAAINQGNSGGPLIDLNGNVVGINVATAIGSNSIGFSIPINSVKSVLAKYK